MYVELHASSAFSFLDGASLPETLIDRAAELEYPALALLDRDGVYGAPRFHKAARAAGIKPIVGCELTIAKGWKSPDIVKVVHDQGGDVLYTSRSSIPYYKPGTFSAELGAKRVGGVFGFRWYFLKWFTQTPESPLERIEACDSNRICDNGRRQRMALVPHRAYISVDSPVDIQRVETALKKDIYWGKY